MSRCRGCLPTAATERAAFQSRFDKKKAKPDFTEPDFALIAIEARHRRPASEKETGRREASRFTLT
jgi:hypothetical protein